MRDSRKAAEDRFNWRLPVLVAAAIGILQLFLMVYSPYGEMLYILIIAPILALFFVILPLVAAIHKRPRECSSLLLATVAFLGVSGALHINKDSLRASLRWKLWSHDFKTEVLTQPSPSAGELRHVEWEATGFAGVANQNVYLVFDPADSLSAAARGHRPGKFKGIPCEVPRVRRLEKQWYSVWFYTDEEWGQSNKLDCAMP
jgi:hypothetical protein